ncbi:MAG TPA: hypothetical protein VJV39_16305, partial [Dongiaceae bacterium]|nr:hypothetical protein [Dongiaceae bacterium]
MTDYFGSQYDDTIVIGGAGGGVTYGGSSKGRKLAKKAFEDKLAAIYDNFAYAGEGNDKVYGGDENDAVDGGNGDDQIWGGKGDDLLVGGNGKDTVYGGSGDDMIGASATTGSTSDNGSDRLVGDGIDTLDGQGKTTALDSFGNDSIFGGNAKDEIWGDSEGDDSSANGGNDVLFGNNGDDSIHGGGGDDEIEGENGADQLWGGKGSDIFGYNSVAESNAAGFDTIWDFTDFTKAGSEYDIIDLSAFGGTLVWGDTDPTKGGVWHKVISGDTFVYADTNGDGAADLTIKLAGIHDLKDNNFSGIINKDDGDATVSISGTAAEHQILTANFGDDDPDGPASGVSYQWQRDGADIGGATGSTYTLVAEDVGAQITVVVTYTDGQGFAETIESDPTAAVVAVDDGDATVSISGTAAEHQVLTANFGDDDPDGAASGVSYQWQRDGVDIGSATASTYTLVADDVGSKITVVVTYTDGQGFAEIIESDETAAVTAVDDGDATVTNSDAPGLGPTRTTRSAA